MFSDKYINPPHSGHIIGRAVDYGLKIFLISIFHRLCGIILQALKLEFQEDWHHPSMSPLPQEKALFCQYVGLIKILILPQHILMHLRLSS